MKTIKIIFFALGLFFSHLSDGGVDPLIVKSGVKYYRIFDNIEVLEDSTNELELKDIKDNDEFARSSQLNFGYTHSTYWYRFTVENSTLKNQFLILHVSYPDLNLLDFYEITDEKVTKIIKTGEYRPFYNREIDHRDYVFKIELKANEKKKYYIRAFNHGDTVNLPLTLKEKDVFFIEDYKNTIFNWMYYGIYLTTLLLNCFLYIIKKDKVYLYYSFYAFFNTFFIINLDGLSYQFLWPNSPWWASHSTILFAITSNIFLILFSDQFLNTKKLINRKWQISKVMTIISIVGLFLCVLPQPMFLYSIYILNVCYPLSCLLIIIYSIYSIKCRNKAAWFILLGFVLFFLATITYQLADMGVLPKNFFLNNSLKIGLIAEGIMLVFAIVYRFKKLEDSKNEELKIAQKNAEIANQLKTSFLSNMSHEIRSPINIIYGYTQLLSQNEKEYEAIKQLGLIEKNCKTLLHLINDIIDIAKIEANTLNINYIYVDINELLSELNLQFKTGNNNVLFLIEKKDNVPLQLYSDRDRLKQVLSNLIINAFNYTDKGSVKLIYEQTEVGIVEFKVVDSGKGIPDSEIDKVFDRFYQVNQLSNKGAGIGLSISKEIINLLGGEIKISSVLNKGTTFSILLPIKMDNNLDKNKESHIVKSEAVKEIQGFERKTILVAEDNEDNYLLIKKILESTDLEIIWAKNGQEAIDLFKFHCSIDLVLMDIGMPNVDGYMALAEIRKSLRGKLTPILAVTAYALDNEKEQCLKSGFDDFIPKPIKVNVLLHSVSSALNRDVKE